MGNREVALALAAEGYFVFPCQSRGTEAKKPIRGVYWRNASTRDARQIERWWSFTPDALPAIDLAKVKLIAIDCDKPKKDGDPDGVDWYRQHSLLEEPTPRTVTGSGGWHVFFRNPDGLGNARGSLPPKAECGIDVRGAGGYVIAPGAELPDGRRYVGHGSPLDAPPLPDWLRTILLTKKAEPVASAAPAPAVMNGSGRLDAYVQAAVDAELADLRTIPEGGRNDRLNKAAFALGTMVGAGWIGEGQATGWLEDAAVANGLAKDDGMRSVRATIRSGLGDGRKKPRSDLAAAPVNHVGEASARALIERDGAYFDPETGEEVDLKVNKPCAAGLPQVGGLVGLIADWITTTSRRPQPALALGAALAVCGTAIGRSLAGPTLSATHLYVIALAPTGAGKDHPLQQCGRLIRAAGMGHHLGPSEFISMSAVINFLCRSPLALCPQDEFGAFLKRVNAKKASSFEASVLKILRTAWGSSFQAMMTPEWAGRAAEQIIAPAISIYGTSTEEEFYAALEGMDRDNGVLNRFLIFSSPKRPGEREPLSDPFDVPLPIVEGLKRLYTRDGVFAAALRNATNLDIEPVALTWGNDGAHDLFTAFRDEVEARSDHDTLARPFLARSVEMAIRIATIVAAGRFSGSVDAGDMVIGRDLALASAELMISGARDHMAESETQAMANRIVRTLREGGGKMQRGKLLYALKHVIKARDLNSLLDEMVEAETIIMSKGDTTKTGGRPPISYLLPTGKKPREETLR